MSGLIGSRWFSKEQHTLYFCFCHNRIQKSAADRSLPFSLRNSLDFCHLHVQGEALATFSCLLWNSEACKEPDPSFHCHAHISCSVCVRACFCVSLLPSCILLPRPQRSSLAPRELLWQLIISWHKAESSPNPPWAYGVSTFTFRPQIGPARCHQAEMQGQQLFPVRPLPPYHSGPLLPPSSARCGAPVYSLCVAVPLSACPRPLSSWKVQIELIQLSKSSLGTVFLRNCELP